MPKHEGQTPEVLSPYAAAKLAGELYCQAPILTHWKPYGFDISTSLDPARIRTALTRL
jgi:nucleoside-diphosphate-sugar epimerase